MTKNWDIFPKVQPYGEDLANFSCYRLYEKSAIAGYGVLSGCVVSRSSASAVAVASGTFTVAGVKKTFAGGSLTSISAAAAGKHRYDLVYIDGADDTLKLAAGTEDTPTSATDFLENYVPRPAGPTDTDWIVLAVIRVTESGIENTNFGTNSYATGSVANMRLGTPFGVDDTTLQVVDGVISVKPSYVKADGATPLTGNWDAGAFKITASQLESDVAAGTAPLVVASDTVIPNLNASKLEGNTASAFAVAAKGVTNGDSHDHSGGDGAAIVAGATSFAATSRVLGRKSAGAGAGEECSITEILDLLGTAERGDILFRGASAWAFLPHGTAGQVLQSGGHGADPSWGTLGLPFVTVGFSADMDYVCDGTADDVQINAAIADLGNTQGTRGGTIMLGPGVFNLAARIDISSGGNTEAQTINLIGAGMTTTILVATGLSEGIRVDFGTGTTDYRDTYGIKDLTVVSADDVAGSIGINVIATSLDGVSVMEHLDVFGFSKQIAFSGQGSWPDGSATGRLTITRCNLGLLGQTGREYGIYIERAAGVNIRDCDIGGYETAGIYLERCDSMHIEDNAIISVADEVGGATPNYGIYATVPDADQYGVDWHITGNAIERSFVAAISLNSTANTIDMMQIFISDNEINGYENGIVVNGSAKTIHSVHIYDNDLYNSRHDGDGRPIFIENVQGFSIHDNTLDISTSLSPYYAIRVYKGCANGTVHGNSIYRGSKTLVEGITVDGDYVSVMGNSFYGTGSIGNGIVLTADSSYCSVIGNVGTSGAITDSGTGNEVAHNT